ncbi:MAG: hypothetical protein ABW185_28205, partial [Sedimenticola sp.]
LLITILSVYGLCELSSKQLDWPSLSTAQAQSIKLLDFKYTHGANAHLFYNRINENGSAQTMFVRG